MKLKSIIFPHVNRQIIKILVRKDSDTNQIDVIMLIIYIVMFFPSFLISLQQRYVHTWWSYQSMNTLKASQRHINEKGRDHFGSI